MTTINSSAGPAATTATAKSGSTLSTSEANSLWQKALQDNVTEARKYSPEKMNLGETRIERYEGKLRADMQEFMAKNPNPTPEALKAHFEDRLSKHVGYETVTKMTDDYFMGKLMARSKELMADRWD